MSDVTAILNSIEENPRAAEDLLPLVYEELRRLAAKKMHGLPPGQTLQATALVHEGYLRLVRRNETHWKGRAHFFSAAAEAMRRILIERIRYRQSQKGGGGIQRVDVADVEIPNQTKPEKLLLIHEALDKLAEEEPLRADVVKLRYFAGLTHAEIAEALGVSDKTIKRYWAYAKAWLYQEITQRKTP